MRFCKLTILSQKTWVGKKEDIVNMLFAILHFE